MAITKAKIAVNVSSVTGVTRRDALLAVDTFLNSIKKALAKGEKVSIVGFGSFRTKSKRSRQGRNPRSGVSIQIPAKRVAFFKAAKELKDWVNKSSI